MIETHFEIQTGLTHAFDLADCIHCLLAHISVHTWHRELEKFLENRLWHYSNYRVTYGYA